MKKFILYLCTIGLIFYSYAQVPYYKESFSKVAKGDIPTGWIISSNTGMDVYERPFDCGVDSGLVTPGVGKDAPSRLILPVMYYESKTSVVIQFKVFVLDATLKCTTAKDFPCATFVRAMLIKENYDGGINSLPEASDIYTEQTYLFSKANGDNTIIFNAPPIPEGTHFRIYLDFKTAINSTCTSTGTKFIFDDFKVDLSSCFYNCPPVANDDYFNAGMQKFFNKVKGNVFGGYALWSYQAPQGYELMSLPFSPAVNNGVDYDNNNSNLDEMQFLLIDGPTIVNPSGCTDPGTLIWNGDGTFEYTRAGTCAQRVQFTYQIKDPSDLYSGIAKVTIDFPSNIMLPVSFISFIANRTNTIVALSWETATETNCNGFYIQRNTGTDWVTRGFVFSASENGNSTSLLSYKFNDSNYNKNTTQYRLLQADKDGRGIYSEVKLVAGLDKEHSIKLLAYPNPAQKVIHILFPADFINYEASIYDETGKRVLYLPGLSGSLLTLNHLNNGIYLLKARNKALGQSSSLKLIITGN